MNKNQILQHINALCGGEAALYACDKLTEQIKNTANPAGERKEIPVELAAPIISPEQRRECEAVIPRLNNHVNNIRESVSSVPTVPNVPNVLPSCEEYVAQNTRGYTPFPLNYGSRRIWESWGDGFINLLILFAAYAILPLGLLRILFTQFSEAHISEFGALLLSPNNFPILWGWIVYTFIGLVVVPTYTNDRERLIKQYHQLLEKHNKALECCRQESAHCGRVFVNQMNGIQYELNSVQETLSTFQNVIGQTYSTCDQETQTRNETLKKYIDELVRAAEINSLWNHTVEEVIDDIENRKQRIRRQLDKLYAQNMVHPSFRNFEAVFCIREYLSKDGCDTLNGAYSRCANILRKLENNYSLDDLLSALRDDIGHGEEKKTMFDDTLNTINQYLEEVEKLLTCAQTDLISGENTSKQHRAVCVALHRNLIDCGGRGYIMNLEKNLHVFLTNPFY